MKNNIHIGALVNAYIKDNKVSKAALSRALNINSSGLAVKLNNEALRTDVLLEISSVLEHNFFADIAALLPKEYSDTLPADTSKDDQIKALEVEIKFLERERETLSDIISRSMQDNPKKENRHG